MGLAHSVALDTTAIMTHILRTCFEPDHVLFTARIIQEFLILNSCFIGCWINV